MKLHATTRSSHLKYVGYDGTTLTVHFQNGDKYRYSGVSPNEFKTLMMAPSPGSFLHSHIRKYHKGERLLA